MSVCSHVLYRALLEDLEEGVTGFATGEPWPGITPRQFAANALSASFYKKFIDHEHEEAEQRAYDKFSQVNSSCANWSLSCNTSIDEVLIGELKQSLYEFFYPKQEPLILNHHQILDGGRTGPGVTRLGRGTDFYTKLYDSPLSVTSPRLYEMYSDYLQYRPEELHAEEARVKLYGEYAIVEGSQLSFVPKSDDIKRSIAIEPNLNMYFQLGLAAILERRLDKYYGINLAIQPDKNRELARIGSVDGSFSTIDLSSASDSLSTKMLDAVMPKPVMDWLKLFRSPVSEYKGELVELSMLSTMGNGYTFPLETILFSAVVSAAARSLGESLDRPYGNRLGNFAVFGDDIIVPTSWTARVMRLLDLLGFKVNQQKTFVEGPFRESCGCDWFSGHDVRGLYIKALSTQQDRYAAINGLVLWSAKTGICLRRTVQYLRSTVRFLPVPPWENVDAGIRVPLDLAKSLRRSKTNSFLYRKSIVSPSKIRFSEAEIRVPRGEEKRNINPSGLLLAFLRGDIKRGSVSVRHNWTHYTTKLAVAPNWDWLPLGCDIVVGTNPGYWDFRSYSPEDLRSRRSTMSQLSWGRWKSAAYFNLLK